VIFIFTLKQEEKESSDDHGSDSDEKAGAGKKAAKAAPKRKGKAEATKEVSYFFSTIYHCLNCLIKCIMLHYRRKKNSPKTMRNPNPLLRRKAKKLPPRNRPLRDPKGFPLALPLSIGKLVVAFFLFLRFLIV